MIPASAKTAISRRSLSSPMAYLAKQGMLVGSTLDFGCGKGYDADKLKLHKFDPYWYPNYITWLEKYDTITCNYVLNTIPGELERDTIIDRILSLLKPNGLAYISVRNDISVSGYTSKGTWQGNILLPQRSLIKTTRQYRMYLLTAGGWR
jgi:hypothetical protein